MSLIKSTLFLSLICILTACASEQIHTDELVTITSDSLFYTTTTVSVDPTNSKNMAIAATRWDDFTAGSFAYKATSFISADGGKTWSESVLPEQENQGNANFPHALYSKKGVLYYSHSVSISGERGTKLAVHKSLDKGKTWIHTTLVNTQSSALPRLTIDEDENVYVVATGSSADPLLEIENPISRSAIMIFKSTDEGESFEPRGISLDNNEGTGPFTLSVFEDGTMWLPFLQFIRSERKDTSYIYGLNSFEKNESMQDVTQIVQLPRRTPYISNNVIDVNGSFKDRLYVTYLEGVQDSLRTAIKYSDNRGASWSPATIIEAENKGHYSRLPTVAVSEKGIVAVSWLQTVQAEGNCWNAYFSYSKDGGNTFSSPKQLSDTAACPADESETSAGHNFLNRAIPFGGHYMGLSPAQTGFQATWAGADSVGFQLYTKHIALPNL